MKGVDFETLNYNGTIADTHIINLFGGMETVWWTDNVPGSVDGAINMIMAVSPFMT